jgi:acyl carrier protein
MSAWEKFEDEVKKLIKINFKVNELTAQTPLSVCDSLAITEICTLAEEYLGVELGFEETRKIPTFGELKAVLEQRMGLV